MVKQMKKKGKPKFQRNETTSGNAKGKKRMIKTISRRGIRLFLTLYLSEPYASMARS